MPVATGPYTAKIAGTPVNIVAGTLDADNQIGQRSTGSLSVWGPLGTVWQYGTAIAVYDDLGALTYSGFISKDNASKPGGARQGTGVLEHKLTLMDNCYKADKRVIFYSNTNVTAGQIVADLVNKVLYAEGVTFTAQTVASGPTIPEVIWNGKTIAYCLNWLAKNAGYWWNIDVNSVLHFLPYGGVPAPFVLDGTQVDARGQLSVTYGNDMFVNTQYCKGGSAEKGTKKNPLIEFLYGDGVKRNFTLSYPISSLYTVILNGVDVTAQSLTKGNNGGKFYYAPGDSVIAQDPGQPIVGNGVLLEVHYAGKLPAIGKAQNSNLIAAQKAREGGGTSGIVESVYSDTKVHTLPAALQIASALLTHYGQDTTILEFDTREKGLLEGQMLTCELPDFNLVNKQMLISAVHITDHGSGDSGVNIWFHVTAVGSPVDSAQFQTFWQNLMNQQSEPSDLTDTSDQQLTPIGTSTFSHSPSYQSSANPGPVQSPICGVTSGPHTMVCGQWTCS